MTNKEAPHVKTWCQEGLQTVISDGYFKLDANRGFPSSMSPIHSSRYAQIQYHGEPGTTQECLDAISRLIQFGDKITKAALLSSEGSHGFLLTVDSGGKIAVKAGFASGYLGEGPRGLATALQLLERHGAEIDEYCVSDSILDAINDSSLRAGQLRELENLPPRRPSRWFDYVHAVEGHRSAGIEHERLNANFRPVLPYSIIDVRIMDLALSFADSPDASLVSAYRRLEDLVRKKAQLESESSTRLFARAFQGDDSALYWEGIEQNESKARASLFDAIYRAYRNPRSHRELSSDVLVELREFLLLNELYVLEASSVRRPKVQDPKDASNNSLQRP